MIQRSLMLELKIVDLTIFNSLSYFNFILILFSISESEVRVNMISHVTITNCHTMVTVTLSHNHVS